MQELTLVHLNPLSKTALVIVASLFKGQYTLPNLVCPTTGLTIEPNTRYSIAFKISNEAPCPHYYWMGFYYILVRRRKKMQVNVFDESLEDGKSLVGYATSLDKFYFKST